jgi:hypothetical protein
MNPKLTVDRLRRRAVVYVRQSSPGQVLHHLAGYGKTAFLTIPRCCRLPFQMI